MNLNSRIEMSEYIGAAYLSINISSVFRKILECFHFKHLLAIKTILHFISLHCAVKREKVCFQEESFQNIFLFTASVKAEEGWHCFFKRDLFKEIGKLLLRDKASEKKQFYVFYGNKIWKLLKPFDTFSRSDAPRLSWARKLLSALTVASSFERFSFYFSISKLSNLKRLLYRG